MYFRLSLSKFITALIFTSWLSCPSHGRRSHWELEHAVASTRLAGLLLGFSRPSPVEHVIGHEGNHVPRQVSPKSPTPCLAFLMRWNHVLRQDEASRHSAKTSDVSKYSVVERRPVLTLILTTAAAAAAAAGSIAPVLADDVRVGGSSFPAPAGRGFAQAPPDRSGLQAKWLEKIRILIQDESDAIQYGGELAPGGPPPDKPALQLIPIVQMRATLGKLKPAVADQKRWDELLIVLTTGPFESREFKRIFNAYSDNIYYASGSSEANAYLLGGATPSSAQTTQYLYRNEALRQIEELRDEIKYQKGLPSEQRETDVATEALQKALDAFDEYLKLAPAEEAKFARQAVFGPSSS